MSQHIAEFFNQLSQEYDVVIERSVPRYREMFWAMLYYLPEDFHPQNILELGCGTGNLTALLAKRWPESKITVVDFSEQMLHITAQKIPSTQLIQMQSSFQTLAFPPNTFDLVISSIAIHHVQDAEKRQLIQNLYTWLKPNGFFVLGDQVRGASQRLYETDVQIYETYAQETGATQDDIQQWREHREEADHYATLDDLKSWLREAGFQEHDVLWRYCFWAVLQAQKQ